MATTGRLDLGGLAVYLEDLARAGQDVDAAAERALEAGAQPVLAEMKRLVPKDEHNLEAHLGTDGPNRDGNLISIDIGVINPDKHTAIYGNVQEFGSSSVTAQPYVRPPFKTRKAAAMRAMKDSLKAEGFTA